MELPLALAKYIAGLSEQPRITAYMHLDQNESISSLGGELSYFGFNDPLNDSEIEHIENLIFSQLPIESVSLVIPSINHENGVSSNLHIVADDPGNWLLFTDVTTIDARRTAIQQTANEDRLEGKRYLRIIERYLGSEFVDAIQRGYEQPVPVRFSAAMIVIRTASEDREDSQVTVDQATVSINIRTDTVIEPIVENRGFIDSIASDEVIGGIRETDAGNAALAAFNSATRIMINARMLETRRASYGAHTPLPGIGISVGQVDRISIGTRSRRSYRCRGPAVDAATKMSCLLEPGEIAVDMDLHRVLSGIHSNFQLRTHGSLTYYVIKDSPSNGT